MTTCPPCGAPTTPVRGHQALCLPCTLTEIEQLHGDTWETMKSRTRTTEKRAAKRMAGGRVDQVNLG